jgi:6-phosphogluconolactonase
MARRALFEPATVPSERIHPIPTDAAHPAASAAAYAQTLAVFFGQPSNGPPPCFDLILLGLGDDGHTASLFPGAAALREERAWVTSSPPGVLPPPVDRVTLTFPVLNAARHVLFLVAGGNKAAAVRDILQGSPSTEPLPAARVTPGVGRLTWLIDEAAAGLLGKA